MTNQELEITKEASSELREIVANAVEFTEAATAANTKRAYAFAVRSFMDWCSLNKTDPLSADLSIEQKQALIALYATDKAKNGELKASSIESYVAGICKWYQRMGHQISMSCATISKVLRGINNKLGIRPTRKEPILTADLRSMLQAIPIEREGQPILIGIRDRALLLLGFTGAFRRSELVALTMNDIKFSRDGFIALVRKSKTDQEGAGIEKIIPYGIDPLTCPVRAMNDWLEASEIKDGPIFRAINKHGHIANEALADNAVARIIKRNPCLRNKAADFSGHSLRSGFVTSAVKNGVPTDLIMKQTGHKSINELNGYIRRGKSFKETAAAMVGL